MKHRFADRPSLPSGAVVSFNRLPRRPSSDFKARLADGLAELYWFCRTKRTCCRFGWRLSAALCSHSPSIGNLPTCKRINCRAFDIAVCLCQQMLFLVDDVAEHSLSDNPMQNLIDLHHLHKLSLLRLFLLLPCLAVALIRIEDDFVPMLLVDATAQTTASH